MGAGLQNVELDDAGAPDAAGADAPARPARRRWPWVLAAVVLVGSLAAGQQVLDARHRAYVARFDSVPGVVPAIGTALSARWKWPEARSLLGMVEVDGRLVTLTADGGDAVVRGLDRATGHTDWTTRLALLPSTDETEPGLACQVLAGGHGRLACLETPDAPQYAIDGSAQARLVVLDGRSGRTISQSTVATAMWGVAGDLVVTATAKGSQTRRAWTVVATRADGSTAWTRTLAAWDNHRNLDAGWTPADRLDGDAGHVLLNADGHAALLDAEGRVTRLLDGTSTSSWSLGRGGVLSYSDESSYHLDTPGFPDGFSTTSLEVDDGSAPDVVLGELGGELAACDARTGAKLWTDAVSLSPLLLGGRLYVTDGTTIAALDVHTGKRLWQHSVPGKTTDVLFTDGRYVYLHTDHTLLGVSIDDGTPGPTIALSGLPGPLVTAWPDGGTVDLLVASSGVLVLHDPDDDVTAAHVVG